MKSSREKEVAHPLLQDRLVDKVALYFPIFPDVQDKIFDFIASDTTQTDGCWNWTGTESNDYPIVVIDPWWVVRVRSLLYRLHCHILPRYSVRALCGNRKCVNPWHMGEGLQYATRMYKPRRNSPHARFSSLFPFLKIKECRNGHPIIGANADHYKSKKHPYQRCRICHYVFLERKNGTCYGRAIQRIEQEIERKAKRPHDWHPDFRGTVGKGKTLADN